MTTRQEKKGPQRSSCLLVETERELARATSSGFLLHPRRKSDRSSTPCRLPLGDGGFFTMISGTPEFSTPTEKDQDV